MAPIPVYTKSPINAASASGVTSQTVPQEEASTSNSVPVSASTTSTTTSAYPPARPGAPAVPAPTGTAAQRYAPLQPTKTTSSEAEGPPMPQPGATPAPLSRHVPPPPRAGETYHPEQTSAPQQPSSIPPQFAIPPPTAAFGGLPPKSSTSTSNTASSSYPVQIPSAESGAPRRSLEHPPGYQQNVYASDMTSEQRRAHEANNASNFGGRESAEKVGAMDSDGSSVWNTAMKWAQQTGEKLSKAETEVWRKINKG